MKYILLYVLGILLIPFSLRAQEGSYSEPINLGMLTLGQTIVDTHNIEGRDDVTAMYSVDYQFEIQESFKVIIRHVEPTSYRSSVIWFDYGNDDCVSFSSVDSLAHFEIELRPGIYRVISYFSDDIHGTITTSLELKSSSPISQPSPNQNYILTRTYTNDVGTAWQDKVDYFDGLGRPEESVLVGSSPTGSDLVTYQEYDGVGRESSKWLPVVLQNNNGAFASLNTIRTKINASYPSEAKPYTLPVYEASPLNRVLEQYGPGQAWQNNSRSAKMAYLTNIAYNDTLNCVYYKVEESSADTIVSIIRSGNYATAQLYVTRSTDEDGNASFEFKDKLGQVVLTRQIQRNGSSKTTYDTYYIYDDYGNLAAVLPPMASDNMKNGTSWTNANSALLRNYAYLYRYDGRKRCIQKRLPGTSWSYYVYDRGDRMIFSQDGEQRAQGKWLFAIPDVFGRTVLTGVCTSIGSKTISVGTFDSNILKGVFSTNGTYNGYNLQLDGIMLTLTDATVSTASYYDNYDFLQLNGFSTLAYDSSAQTDYGSRYTGGYQGMLTGSYTAQAPGSTASVSLYSALYYDNRNRIIQSASTNHLGGKETECIFYTFTGQPMRKKHIHTATGKVTQTEFYSYAYDHAGRLLTVKHKLDSNGNEIVLARNTYDELGRLKTNQKNEQANLTTTYAYNIRSWMKSSSSPLFSQTLYYNDSYGNNTPRYNGNISAMNWTTSGDKTRGYNFAYDNLSRLTAAGYLEGGVANTSYGTSYVYDKHGNMTNLIRNGRTGTSTFGTADNLSMSYAGNQLIKADDAGTNVTLSVSMDFKNNSTAAKEYFYDLNGNLTQDLNKGITGVTYNLLNLPQSITIANTLGQATNTYMYAADGRKLQAVIGSKRTDYVGNVIYEGGVLKRILVDGGYIEGGGYYFYLTDHLGNNRVIANASGGIVQTNYYYPFGMSFAEGVAASGQPYKYNGKELDTERGLNLYDYSARLVDPVLGRFSTMDPKAEKYYGISPYSYCGNNPIARIDKDGREWTYVVDANGHATINVALNFSVLGNYTTDQIIAYKNAIATQFNNTISEVSNGTMSGTITFYEGNQNITQTLALDKMDTSIGGVTSFFNSSVNLYNRAGELRPLSNIASDVTHEMLHTLRLEHPFEVTQTEDTKLLRIAPNSFVTTPITDANIVNNVMSYPMITIDGQKSTNQNSLTKGQLDLMINEINLQGRGYGFQPKYNPSLTPEQNANLYKQYYENYWLNSPGSPVGNK